MLDTVIHFLYEQNFDEANQVNKSNMNERV